jgi:hypothetical protein
VDGLNHCRQIRNKGGEKGKKEKRKKTTITVEEETDWSKLLTDA